MLHPRVLAGNSSKRFRLMVGQELSPDRKDLRDETSSSEGRSYQHSEGEPEVIEPIIYEHEVWNLDHDAPEVYYYIVPGGLNVIFRDEEGNVSRRVGEFGDTIHKPRRVSPTVIQDEFGNELYRTGDFGHALTPGSMSDEDQEEQLQPHSRSRDRRMHRSRGHSGHDESQHNASPYGAERSVSSKAYSAISYASVPSNAANIILIDDRGQQIPIRTSGGKSPSFGANVRHAGQYSH
ncbi:hypothetical protein FPV67DRAFT_409833 [Lyophyllum atratum]|nr:hypothetical protein FPV67DRAFT_409833 [Lyophyllum atratum]